ncbi:hypothetical protein [Devosia nitrariae]|uniref:Uncharacterized protein n=1 Tax=Devosia nitrariae TaxID=2071872 RepID=A0ABQ5VZM1_9HYPH|nr:hypothetical protein [Devosia nitrariae]GLQ52870.1 hypothetical protein GCM10010862_01280 [Devosia nitrariae]
MPAPGSKLRLPALIALTTGPALVVGVGLWVLTELVPECRPDVRENLTSPDGAVTLVVFGLDCGATIGSNTQAAVHMSDELFSQETAQVFFAADGAHDLAPRWTAAGEIEITEPAGATVHRRLETIDEIPVTYR